jgi:hypothetical protein
MAKNSSGSTRGGDRVPQSHLNAQNRNNRNMAAQPTNAHSADARNAKVGQQVEANRLARVAAQPRHVDASQNALPVVVNRPATARFAAFQRAGEKGGKN